MSDTENAAAPPPKKKKKLLKLLVLAGVVLGAGGGAAVYAGMVPLGGGGLAKPDLPELVAKEGVDPIDFSVKGERPIHADQFQATYYPLTEPFTSNLVDDGGFVQVDLGVSTYYDERVVKNVETHEMAIRSAVLMTLAEQNGATLATQAGKTALKAELAKAINGVLKAKEGFGGIDDVYFTSFVMQ